MKSYATPTVSLRQGIMAMGSALVASALVLALLWLLSAAPATPALAQGNTRYVAPDGNDESNDCANSATPCRTVQHAVDQAHSADEIRVATGVYTGVQMRAGITQVVYISKTVTVRGGYTTADWDTPDPEANPTTLDAQGLGRVLVISGTPSAGLQTRVLTCPPWPKVLAVLCQAARVGQAITPTVEGLRITGGDAARLGGTPWGWEDAGGGVYVYTATATISGCVVYSNVGSTADRGKGGGLYLEYSDATLASNTVQGNTASTFLDGSGGGLYLYRSHATLKSNTILGNIASTALSGSGGGLSLNESAATLWDNMVQDNTASTADRGSGGGLFLDESAATLRDNTVQGNTASTALGGYASELRLLNDTVDRGYGGGLYLLRSAATLQGNAVQGNIASTVARGYGGGLYLWDSAATLHGNAIVSNTAAVSPTVAGWGGGLYVESSSPFTLTNILVAGNQGSGLWFEGSSDDPTLGHLRHNTIADNGSTGLTTGPGSGQGVYVGSYATLAFTNTIIAGHPDVGINVTAGSTVTLEATLWHSNGTHTGGVGTILTGTVNVHGDPTFVDPTALDYHLGAGSAAIDAGVDAGVTADIDGDPRPWPPGGGYDIGADEAIPTMSLTKIGPARFNPGTHITYTLCVTNTGRVTATGVILTDALPVGSTFAGASDGGLAANGIVTWPIFSVAPEGGVVTHTFAITADDAIVNHDYWATVPGILAVKGIAAVHTAPNRPPTADAGDPPAAGPGASVTLDGSASSDPNGDLLTYNWTQAGGTLVTFAHNLSVTTFTAPTTAGVLTFTLTVTDSLGLPDPTPDEVTVTVQWYQVYLPLVLDRSPYLEFRDLSRGAPKPTQADR